jgi:hypothetical protein
MNRAETDFYRRTTNFAADKALRAESPVAAADHCRTAATCLLHSLGIKILRREPR